MTPYGLHLLRDWIESSSPTSDSVLRVMSFLIEAGETSWVFPSVPIGYLSHQPHSEMRMATLHMADGSTVTVWYCHVYEDDSIEVVDLRSL